MPYGLLLPYGLLPRRVAAAAAALVLLILILSAAAAAAAAAAARQQENSQQKIWIRQWPQAKAPVFAPASHARGRDERDVLSSQRRGDIPVYMFTFTFQIGGIMGVCCVALYRH